MDNELLNKFGAERINSRQMDELIGLARGLSADGEINQAEAEFLQSWLSANLLVSHQPLFATLYQRIKDVLSDGVLDNEEAKELLETLHSVTGENIELGEMLKSSTLPLCSPAPTLSFAERRYCFTGTFTFGCRKECEQAAADRGAIVGSLTAKTNYLVIGAYATESWKHSSFGNKIIKATSFRDKGYPIAIVSEDHWVKHLS